MDVGASGGVVGQCAAEGKPFNIPATAGGGGQSAEGGDHHDEDRGAASTIRNLAASYHLSLHPQGVQLREGG